MSAIQNTTPAQPSPKLTALHAGLQSNPRTVLPENTRISSESVLTAPQLAAFLLSREPNPRINTDALSLARYFITIGDNLGIRGDIAFMMSIHETGWFRYGGQVLPEQNNFAGIGATNNSPVGLGAWFDSPELGVKAQIHHLYAYAKGVLAPQNVSPRANIVISLNRQHGNAEFWQNLNGRWAVPGTTYAQMIFNLYRQAVAFVMNDPALWCSPELEEALTQRAEYPDYDPNLTLPSDELPAETCNCEQSCECPSWAWALKHGFIDNLPGWDFNTRPPLGQVIEILHRVAMRAGNKRLF